MFLQGVRLLYSRYLQFFENFLSWIGVFSKKITLSIYSLITFSDWVTYRYVMGVAVKIANMYSASIKVANFGGVIIFLVSKLLFCQTNLSSSNSVGLKSLKLSLLVVK